MKNIWRLIGLVAVVGWLGLGIGGGAGEETGLRTAGEPGVERGLATGEHILIGERLPAGFYERLFERLYATKGTDTPREKNLTDSPSDDRDAAWSPAGDAVMFSSNGVDANNDGKLEADTSPTANYNLWTMRVDGTQLHQVTNDAGNETESVWSPEGRSVAFISDRTAQPQVFVRDIATGSEVQITAGAEGTPGNKAHPAWGTLGIVLASNRNGNWDLWSVQPDGTELTQLTYDTADDIQPSFASDKVTVGFASNRTGTYRIYTIPSSNALLPEDQRRTEPGLYQRTSGGAAVNDTEPNFRLVDRSLFFTSDRPVGGSGSDLNIWRGSRSVNLAAAGTWDGSPVLVENFRLDDQAVDENAISSRVDPGLAGSSSEPYRVIFETNRTGNRDLWSIIPEQDDVEPPRLMSLPTETPKVAPPGLPVTIRVRVEDNFDEWHTIVEMGTYDMATGAFTDGSPIEPPPPNDAVDLEGLVLEGLNGTCSVTVTGVNQDDVAGRTWTGAGDNLRIGQKFALTPTNVGDLCKDVTNVQATGTATAGEFLVRAFRDRVEQTTRGTRLVQAVFREPYEFAGSRYGTQMVQTHTDHCDVPEDYNHVLPWETSGENIDNLVVLNCEWPRNNGAPEAGRIDLRDDGIAPDEVAWDGIYTGTWTPPRGIDYLLDIEATDWAGNYFVYDNVGGLSRSIFNPTMPPAILLVFDWTEGQRWTAYDTGPYYSAVPVEMHWTGYDGTEFVVGDPDPDPGAIAGDGENMPPNVWDPRPWTIWHDNHLDNRWGSSVPRDIWRTQCRGRIPKPVLAAYVARVQMQPDPTDPALRPTRAVSHAQSCIIWAAPYSGDEWVQPGSILDIQTQNDLTWFVENGGRLCVSGEDVAWALSADGTVSNAFLSSVLLATYVSDSPTPDGPDPMIGAVLDGTGPLTTCSALGDLAWPDPYDGSLDPPKRLFLTNPLAWVSTNGDAAPNQWRPDVVSPIAPAQGHYVYRRDGDQTWGAAGTYADRTGQSGLRTKTVFFSFGLEGIHRQYSEVKERVMFIVISHEWCRNKRAKVWHDVNCWLCDWRLTGRVIHNQGLFPIPKTLILVDPVLGADGKPTLQAPYTGITSADGTFQVEGLPAGGHNVWVYAPGFFWHFYGTGGGMHGHDEISGVDLKLTEAEPGGISGTVTAAGTGTPINGATVTATLIGYYLGEPLQVKTVSDANGYYEILRLPTGFYNVSGSAPNYGTVTIEQVRVDPGVIKRDVNLALPAAPGSLSGTVTDAGTGDPIEGALVEAVAGTLVTGSATTDADGHYDMPEIAAGTHQVTASAAGYAALTKAVTIEPAQAKVTDFALSTTPPGSMSGVVKEAATGLPSAGAIVRVLLGQTEVASTTTAGELTTEGTYSFNYRLQVPAGTYQVRVTKANRRVVPEFRSVTVVSQQETKSVNFDLEALHSFATGISLISFPYGYTGVAADPAVVLGLTQAQLTGNMAYWNSTAYALYPTAPMSSLVLGSGYFLRLTQPTVVDVEGTQTANDPFVIPLRAGWNMIGDPFTESVDWYDVRVRSGANVYGMVDALAQGLVRGRLWSFDGTQYRITLFLGPWVGNWVQAGQGVDLLVPAPARGARGPGREARVVDDGWGFALLAGVGEAMDSVYLGSSPAGKEGHDVFDALQPPTAVGEGLIDVYFDKSAWVSEAGRYGVEVKGDVSSGRKRWEFTVETKVGEATVYLAWPNLKEVPGAVSLTLEDTETGRRQDMRQTTTYRFSSGPGGLRRFAVVAERRSQGTMAVTSFSVAREARAWAFNVGFTLSEPGWVTVEVLNLVGQTVRMVKAEEAMAAGANEVVWDGRNEAGALAPNGNYICEVTAKNEAGEVVNVLRTFVVVW